ncbi:hypothetical protein BGW36DRAFT_74579 [Talaromyces proteolyticus]|uniref:Uncharacterized protein n=1 Tax=Talaromyces proteolyticus TaxID=1131652 RepID=A0AAD4KEF6_9EURO|nr:uncharacterized protein BGW36DRAFT_74579 [Talaromyces proteolyticus]KAH8689673.1 hypothetical protein BGW36DRAFT_74579 [Talaromyces proteolyticus]
MEPSSSSRSRNLWSAEEDGILRGLVEAYEKDKVDWRVIASYLPGRNNKDCRKRWHYRVSASMNLGPWSQAEDELLKLGIQRYGTHWSRVAQVVGTRNGDQCFKRWNDVLDPAIDRSPWTREEDRLLLLAINKYGRAWKQIVDAYFPGRTGLDAKNRHRQLTRKRKREEKGDNNAKSQEASLSIPPVLPKAQAQAQAQAQLPETPNNLPTSKLSSAVSPVGMSANTANWLSPRSQQPEERPLSVPPYFDWNLSMDTMLSPALPTTPYSTCSNSSISNAGGSLSELDEYFTQQLATSHVDHSHGLVAGIANYPYSGPTPDGNITDVRYPHYMAEHAVLDMRSNPTPIRPMSAHQPFWGPGWDVTT